MSKTKTILTLLCSLYSVVSYATSYTWNGTTSTAWGTSTNWTPNGVPTGSDDVTIVSASNQPTYTAGTGVNNFTMTSGTLNLGNYTFYIYGTATFNGGTITNGIVYKSAGTATVTFDGTLMDCKVTCYSSDIYLNGSEFNKYAYFVKSGSSANYSDGGNVFNDTITVNQNGSGIFSIGITYPDTFNSAAQFSTTSGYFGAAAGAANNYFAGDVRLKCGSANGIFMNYAGTAQYMGNIYVENTSTGTIYFGASTGSGTLASGKTIIEGSNEYTGGELKFKNFTKYGSTPVNLTFSSSVSLTFGSSCTLNGAVTYSGGNYYLNGTTFNSDVSFTKTGNTDNYSSGGNVFNGNAVFTNTSSNPIYLANTTGDDFNANATFTQTGSGRIYPGYNGSSTFAGNITANGSNNSDFGNGSTLCRNTLDGSGVQTIDGTAPQYNFKKLKVSKAGGYVTLGSLVSISDSLVFYDGIIKTAGSDVISLKDNTKAVTPSDSSYVEGAVVKKGDDAFTYPVGRNGHYRPIAMSAPSSTNDIFYGEYINKTSDDDFSHSSKDGSIAALSRNEYWNLVRYVGSSTVNVTLSWDTLATSCSFASTANLKVCSWDGSTWKDRGNGSTTGNLVKGTVVSSGTSSTYGAYALGSSSTFACRDFDFTWDPATAITATEVEVTCTSAHIPPEYTFRFSLEHAGLSAEPKIWSGLDLQDVVHGVIHSFDDDGNAEAILYLISYNGSVIDSVVHNIPFEKSTGIEFICECNHNNCDHIANPDFSENVQLPDDEGSGLIYVNCWNKFLDEYDYCENIEINQCSDQGGTPDYYNANSTGTQFSVPNNLLTTIPVNSVNLNSNDDAYAGIIAYHPWYISTWNSEYLIQQLETPLTPNITYKFRMYVQVSNRSTDAVNVGVLFTEGAACQNGFDHIDVTQLTDYHYETAMPNLSTGFLYDFGEWNVVEFEFTADNPYSFITIGHFDNDHDINDNVWFTIDPDPLHYDNGQTIRQTYFFIDEVSLKPAPPIIDDEEIEICDGEQIQITAHGAGTGNIYHWSADPADATLAENEGAYGTITVTPTENTVYTVTVESNLDGCELQDAISVIVNPNTPTITLTGDENTCKGTTVHCVPGDPEGVEYTWEFEPELPVDAVVVEDDNCITVTWGTQTAFGATITVTITNIYGCTSSAQMEVEGCCLIEGQANVEDEEFPFITNPGLTITVGGTTIASQTFTVNGTWTITDNLTLDDCDVTLGPNAVIIVEPGQKLTITDNSHLHACGEMWGAIHVAPTAQIEINGNSLIEDALWAVYLNTPESNTYTIDEAVFNRNVVHIYYFHSRETDAGTITNTDFTCTADLAPPFTGEHTYAGIFVYGASRDNMITVGAATDGNTFDNANFGIWSMLANITSRNNTFTNIEADGLCTGSDWVMPNANNCGSGIYTLGLRQLFVEDENHFEDSRTGVYSNYGWLDVVAADNTFDNVTNGIQVFNAPRPNTEITITGNFMEDVVQGIYCRNNPAADITIGGADLLANTIDVEPVNINFWGQNFDYGLGIYVQESQPLASTRIHIENNTVTNAPGGIGTMNTLQNNVITENSVTMFNSGAGTPFGIAADNSTWSGIFGNQVSSGNITDENNSGIRVSSGVGNWIVCNTTNTIGTGLHFEGALQPSFVLKNQMIDHHVGILLNNGTLGNIGGGPISPDPDPIAWDNTWEGDFWGEGEGNPHTFARNCDANNYTIFYRDEEGIYLPEFNDAIPNPGFAFDVPLSGTTNNLSSWEICPEGTGVHGLLGEGDLKNLVLDVLTDESEKLVYHDELTWTNKLGIYTLLIENDSVIDSDPIITDFYDSCFASNMGVLIRAANQFEDVENNLTGGNGYDYLDSLENMTSTILPESTLLEVLTVAFTRQLDTNAYATIQPVTPQSTLLSATLAGIAPDTAFAVSKHTNTYNSAQRTALQEIAEQCPFEYGPGVYMARAMLSQMDTIAYMYRNDCEYADGGSGKWDGENEPERTQVNNTDGVRINAEFVLYPNPNDGNMYVEFRYLTEAAYFELYDVTGRKVATYNLTTENGILNISERALSNGVYLFRITNDKHKFKFGKVIISK